MIAAAARSSRGPAREPPSATSRRGARKAQETTRERLTVSRCTVATFNGSATNEPEENAQCLFVLPSIARLAAKLELSAATH